MGCDIHIIAQKRNEHGEWTTVAGNFAEGPAPFDWRQYGMFAFLAGVRNYSAITPISEERGLPEDMDRYDDGSAMDLGDHSFSWLAVEELLAVDYDQTIEDRRCTREIAPGWMSGSQTCEPGEGNQETLREFLGEQFFDDLAKLNELGAERIVFGFDS